MRAPMKKLCRPAAFGGVIGFPAGNRENDVVSLLLEFENELHFGKFVEHAEFDRGGGTQEIHRVGGVWSPRSNVLEIQTRLFLLN